MHGENIVGDKSYEVIRNYLNRQAYEDDINRTKKALVDTLAPL